MSLVGVAGPGEPARALAANLAGHGYRGATPQERPDVIFLLDEEADAAIVVDGAHVLSCGLPRRAATLRDGPAYVVGGNHAAYLRVRPILRATAAREQNVPCVAYAGTGAAGHNAQRVHDDLAATDVRLATEAYQLIVTGLGRKPEQAGEIFAAWNTGELSSALMETAARILDRPDDRPFAARLTAELGIERSSATTPPGLGVGHSLFAESGDRSAGPGAGSSAAVESGDSALGLGAGHSLAVGLGDSLPAQGSEHSPGAERGVSGPGQIGRRSLPSELDVSVAQIFEAVYVARIAAYARGFERLPGEHRGEIASAWRAGSAVGGRFLTYVREAFELEPVPGRLDDDIYFAGTVRHYRPTWRRVVAEATRVGLEVPVLRGLG
ncbi:hypothetical protein M1L60_45015 [Actinoplanes sp. TRM 88003]|uniref:6-phosphogluconate dehydrogenase C-terminal domain-containing protein n=1 Tax=Paractinoplanes aksuensis TaxID=2939490 RepID=A0ABT1E3Q5_9ACTN|nr:hypothetical protein [Actinoplanes aksuensis]MCO8277759.1 hypothetical protein [Actinoplanes aksuensis]